MFILLPEYTRTVEYGRCSIALVTAYLPTGVWFVTAIVTALLPLAIGFFSLTLALKQNVTAVTAFFVKTFPAAHYWCI